MRLLTCLHVSGTIVTRISQQALRPARFSLMPCKALARISPKRRFGGWLHGPVLIEETFKERRLPTLAELDVRFPSAIRPCWIIACHSG